MGPLGGLPSIIPDGIGALDEYRHPSHVELVGERKMGSREKSRGPFFILGP